MLLSQLGLRPEQIAQRRHFVGGSDANILLSGDADKIIHLWRVKRGEAEAEDLSNVLQVQLGSFTEPFNRAWYEKQTGTTVEHVGEERASLDVEFMATTLDGIVGGQILWQAKHLSAFAKDEEALAKYLPQLTHEMIVCGLKRAHLSVIFGNHRFAVIPVELDMGYARQLIEVEAAFWQCVKTGRVPVAIEVKQPVVPVRTADMTGSNAWAVSAADWLRHKDAAKAFADAADSLKALVEPDVVEAFGHGVTAKRNKAGAITISVPKAAKGGK